MTGWIPVPSEVMGKKILPLIKENVAPEGHESTVEINTSKDVPISGWHEVNASVVREEIEPIIRKHRLDD